MEPIRKLFQCVANEKDLQGKLTQIGPLWNHVRVPSLARVAQARTANERIDLIWSPSIARILNGVMQRAEASLQSQGLYSPRGQHHDATHTLVAHSRYDMKSPVLASNNRSEISDFVVFGRRLVFLLGGMFDRLGQCLTFTSFSGNFTAERVRKPNNRKVEEGTPDYVRLRQVASLESSDRAEGKGLSALLSGLLMGRINGAHLRYRLFVSAGEKGIPFKTALTCAIAL
jgi:hypothetical protein